MASTIQQRYWTNLTELKGQSLYLNAYLIRSERNESVINAILAIASSSSIGAWVVWKDLWIIWTAIIAGSQVITAIRPILPYGKRIKPLRSLVYAFDNVFLRAEYHWLEVSNGSLSEGEINKLLTDLKTEIQAQWEKQMGDMSLPENTKLLELAKEQATVYFQTHYHEQSTSTD